MKESILKHNFDLSVEGDGLDIYPQLESGFGTMRTILPMLCEASEQKMGQNFEYMEIKFVLPIIHFITEGQTQLEVNWTQIDHYNYIL